MINPLITLYTLIKDKELNEQSLSELIKNGIDLNFYATHCTPLSYACKLDSSIEIIRLLLDHGADVRARKDESDRTPLLWACEYTTDIKVLELLLERGANPNDAYFPTHRDEHTTLTVLSINDKPAAYTELLLKYGADPNGPKSIKTSFAYCFGYADYSMDHEVKTTFKNSVANGELLIMAGATTDNFNLSIPLAARAPNEVLVFLLGECNIEATPEDFYLFCAYAVPSIELVDLFMAKGAALADLCRIVGLLIYQEHSYNAIKHIIEFVNNPHYCSTVFAIDPNYGYEGTVLHYACHNNRQDIVKLLLAAGVSTNIKDTGCHIVYKVYPPPPLKSGYAYSLIEAGKLIVIYRDLSSEFERYIVMARDTHGNVFNKLWNFTPPERHYFQETVPLGKDYVPKLKEVEFTGPAVANYILKSSTIS
ncbi:MAG: ankyrin repeat domain-containing protein [Candidatus Babeliales bacterium]